MLPSPERRAVPRHLSVFEMSVSDEASGEDMGLVLDAAVTGLRIVCPRPLQVGKEVAFVLESSLEEASGGVGRVRGVARVVWCKSSAKHPALNAVGLHFERFESNVARDTLMRWIARECLESVTGTALVVGDESDLLS